MIEGGVERCTSGAMAAGNMADSVPISTQYMIKLKLKKKQVKHIPGNTPPSGNAAGMNIVGKDYKKIQVI